MCISVDLHEAFDYAESINVYNEGNKAVYSNGGEEYNKILASFKSLIDGAHEMPAYGVSLNNATSREMKSGLWTEFVFDKRYESNGLPFEKLLINVQKNFYGFNIIRYNTGYGYDGRCFYYDLVNKNMDDYYNLVLSFGI